MPRNYVLKKDLLNKDSVNRLIKSIIDNAKEDRDQAKFFLDEARNRFDIGVTTHDEFSKVATAAAQLLSKLQDSSVNLVKAMDAIIKYMSVTKSKAASSDKAPALDDLFSELSKIQED
jgi:viroplasmin and RNaseH domain-containing protein